MKIREGQFEADVIETDTWVLVKITYSHAGGPTLFQNFYQEPFHVVLDSVHSVLVEKNRKWSELIAAQIKTRV